MDKEQKKKGEVEEMGMFERRKIGRKELGGGGSWGVSGWGGRGGDGRGATFGTLGGGYPSPTPRPPNPQKTVKKNAAQ